MKTKLETNNYSHRYATEVDFEIYDMGPLSPLHDS